jgi:hypothetical protein
VNCPKTWDGQMNRNVMRCSYCGSNKHNVNACPGTFAIDNNKNNFIKD